MRLLCRFVRQNKHAIRNFPQEPRWRRGTIRSRDDCKSAKDTPQKQQGLLSTGRRWGYNYYFNVTYGVNL